MESREGVLCPVLPYSGLSRISNWLQGTLWRTFPGNVSPRVKQQGTDGVDFHSGNSLALTPALLIV